MQDAIQGGNVARLKAFLWKKHLNSLRSRRLDLVKLQVKAARQKPLSLIKRTMRMRCIVNLGGTAKSYLVPIIMGRGFFIGKMEKQTFK